MPVAAFCTDIPEFQDGRILEFSYASRFPGAAVIAEFAARLRARGWAVVTGDQVLADPRNSTSALEDVFVVQEEDSLVGRELIRAGATPALLINGESPLFARHFYFDPAKPCAPFPHRILFTGTHESAGESGLNHPLYFPARHIDADLPLVPWRERKHLALLASNKYWRHSNTPWPERFTRLLREARHPDQTRWIKRNQLHDERLRIVAHLNSVRAIDVYGAGWDSTEHLPREFREALMDFSPVTTAVEYKDKQVLLSKYRFTLAIENFSFPGYVTEKIFDALAAGSIPVYLGAPDIEEFVPPEVFVDVRKFAVNSDLIDFLDRLDEETGMTMIQAGHSFLASQAGQRHTFENRGEFFAALVEDVATNL